MAVATAEVSNKPQTAPTSAIDSLKQQVNALSVQINLLKAEVSGSGKNWTLKKEKAKISQETLNKLAKQMAYIPHKDRKIEFSSSLSNTSTQGLINLLWLKEIEMNKQKREYYAIPFSQKVFIKQDMIWFYYFRENELFFVPDFKNYSPFSPVQHIYLGTDSNWNHYRDRRYPPFSMNILEYLNFQTFGEEIDDILEWEEKLISYDRQKYYVESFGHKIPIWFTILSGERIVPWSWAESIWTNIQLLSFQNFLSAKFFDTKKIEKTWTTQFRFDSKKWIYLANAEGKQTFMVLDLPSSPFFSWTNKTPVINQYVQYLNFVFFDININT